MPTLLVIRGNEARPSAVGVVGELSAVAPHGNQRAGITLVIVLFGRRRTEATCIFNPFPQREFLAAGQQSVEIVEHLVHATGIVIDGVRALREISPMESVALEGEEIAQYLPPHVHDII